MESVWLWIRIIPYAAKVYIKIEFICQNRTLGHPDVQSDSWWPHKTNKVGHVSKCKLPELIQKRKRFIFKMSFA